MQFNSSLRNGLVGAWCPSVSGWGGNVLRDLSGFNNHGRINNSDLISDWSVDFGQAIDFDGVGTDFVTIGTTPNLIERRQLEYTISAWFKLRDTSTTYSIWGAYKTISNGELYQLLRIDTTTLKYYTTIEGGYFQSRGTLSVSSNVWTFAAITVSGTETAPTLTMWVNDVSETHSLSALRVAGPASGVDIRIGNVESATAEGFLGLLDDVRFYARSLSASEIQQLYYGGRGVGLRPKRKRRYVSSSTNRRRRLICGANC